MLHFNYYARDKIESLCKVRGATGQVVVHTLSEEPDQYKITGCSGKPGWYEYTLESQGDLTGPVSGSQLYDAFDYYAVRDKYRLYVIARLQKTIKESEIKIALLKEVLIDRGAVTVITTKEQIKLVDLLKTKGDEQ